MTVTGRCLCGGVRYEVHGNPSNAGYCHCSMCRLQSGTAFSAVASVDANRFRWTAGEDLVSRFESSPGVERIFCRTCGSNLGLLEGGKIAMIGLGTVTDDPGVRPTSHIFVGSKAVWHEITDTLPRHSEWPSES